MELKEGMMVRVRPGAGTMAGEKGEIVSSFEYTYLILTNSGLQEVTHTVCRVKFKGKNVTLPYLAEELEPVRKEVEVEPRIHDTITIHLEGSEGLNGIIIAILEVVEGKLYQVLRDDGKSLWLRPEELEVKQSENKA